ncbi:MAG: hypothetical protein RIM99_10610 [Cyclobacteriaceae bacterium]
MKRKIPIGTDAEANEILSTFEKSQNLFKINKGSSEVEFEFEDRYFQFFIDKIESLGYSKGQLTE